MIINEHFIRGFLYRKGTLGFQRPVGRKVPYPYVRFKVSDDVEIWKLIFVFFHKKSIFLDLWKDEIYVRGNDNLKDFFAFFEKDNYAGWKERPKWGEFCEVLKIGR